MASFTTKIKVKQSGVKTLVLTLVKHPMETGQRVDKKTKKKIPAHYIQKMTFAVGGKQVAEANLGPAVSKDPLVGVQVKNAKKGDKVKVSWTDNKGNRGSAEKTVA